MHTQSPASPDTDEPVSVRVRVLDGKIHCAPDPVLVVFTPSQLRFRLQTPGYAFPGENAVVVSNPGSDFPTPARTVAAQLVTLCDLDRVKGSYRYTVQVVEQATGRVLRHDPTISNDPE